MGTSTVSIDAISEHGAYDTIVVRTNLVPFSSLEGRRSSPEGSSDCQLSSGAPVVPLSEFEGTELPKNSVFQDSTGTLYFARSYLASLSS